MRRKTRIFLCILLLSILSACQRLTESPVEKKCRELGEEKLKEAKEKFPDSYVLTRTETFFSKSLGTCIQTQSPEPGSKEVEFYIDDISQGFLKDTGQLFGCDKAGVDSAILDKVQALNGYVFREPYKNWLDDGFGGLPRTIKTPEKPYTQDDCLKVFNRWITYLKK